MRAAVTHGAGQGFSLEDVEIADPIGSEVLVELRASGLCRSDLSAAKDGIGGLYPTTALNGHEPAGEVVAVGPDVHDFAVGDRVVGTLIQACGACAQCLTGRSNICAHPERTLRPESAPPRLTMGGEPLHQQFGLGAFAQRILAHENQLAKIPDGIPWASAALLGCGVITGAGAVLNRARVRQGESAVIVGAGGVGLNAVMGAVIAAAHPIIAVDVDESKLEVAKKLGATHTVNSKTSDDPVAEVAEITGGGADHVFDFVRVTPVLETSLAMVGRGGGLYLVGLSDGVVSFPSLMAIAMERSVTGAVMGSTTFKRDIPMYADLYLSHRFLLDELITDEIALSEVDEGFEKLGGGSTIRAVITDFEH